MWILIDLSYMAHRARFALKGLSSDDFPTGVIYGFFEQVYACCSKFQSNKVLVFADSKQSFRSKVYPLYKSNRKDNLSEEELESLHIMYKQIKVLKKMILPAMGISVYQQKGLESDDLIAWTARRLTEKGQEGVIITSDGDLFQCITSKIGWYDPQKDLLYNPLSFEKNKGIKPDQWGLVKAIGGCATDCVPGIKGVSEKGAIDFLLDMLPHSHKKYRMIQEEIKLKKFRKWKELVILPHEKTKPIKIKKPKYDPESFFEYCERFDILSYLEDKKERWEKFFENKFPGPSKRKRKAINQCGFCGFQCSSPLDLIEHIRICDIANEQRRSLSILRNQYKEKDKKKGDYNGPRKRIRIRKRSL